MNKIKAWISYFILFVSFCFLSLIIFWEVYPYKIADFKTPFKIVNPVVKRGDRVRYIISGCKYVDASPYITKFFIDGVVYETPKSVSVVSKGCEDTIADAYIPKAIPPGIYSIQTVAEYEVNPIRKVKVINFTEQFVIE